MDSASCSTAAMENVTLATQSKKAFVPMFTMMARPMAARNSNGSTHEEHMTKRMPMPMATASPNVIASEEERSWLSTTAPATATSSSERPCSET